MLITMDKKAGSAYFEFQYCKKNWTIKKLVNKGYAFWQPDSLLVHIEDDMEFFEHYLKYLEPTNAPNGTQEFCFYGVNYYTKEQTQSILDRIKQDKPKECEILIAWLEKAVSDYNGFYFLGI